MAPRSTNIVQLGTYIACPLLPQPNETCESFGSVRGYISFLSAKKLALVCASVVFLHLKYIAVQDDNLSRGTFVLKAFWYLTAFFPCFFIIKINGRADLKCEIGGTCGTHGETSAQAR